MSFSDFAKKAARGIVKEMNNTVASKLREEERRARANGTTLDAKHYEAKERTERIKAQLAATEERERW